MEGDYPMDIIIALVFFGVGLGRIIFFAEQLVTGAVGTSVGFGISTFLSAAFILVNSVAGLFGETVSVHALPSTAPLWAGVVVAGGLIGSELGARRLAEVTLRRLLAVVLAMAGLKLILVRR